MNTQMAVPLQEDRTPDDSLMQILATRSLSIMLLQSVSTNHFIRKRIIKKKGKEHARFQIGTNSCLADRVIPKITQI